MKSQLRKELQKYLNEQDYPLHMPGHKRRLMPEEDLPYAWDLTEVSGSDDLHHAEGILKNAMQRTADLCHADRSWYLVNGSTVGNLAGVYALTHQNGQVIMARNCHRSLFHIAQLRNLTVHWLMPDSEQKFQITAGIDPDQVKHLLVMYPHSEAVILTSPTYEGVVSDIQAIADICHQYNVPLFVDEAHGAHFGLSPFFPASAIQNGADMAVQSFHKTLPSLTQTAVLHIKRGRVDEKKVEQALDIFETSSPSYPLMVSLDACTEYVIKEGSACFEDWHKMLIQFDQNIRNLHHLKVLCHQQDLPADHGFYAFDTSKILIHSDQLSGKQLQKILLEKYHFELEMSMGNNALAMSGPGDDPEQIQRFAQALLEIDEDMTNEDLSDCQSRQYNLPACRLTISDALESESEHVPLSQSAGHIAHEYCYCYPPGIPLIIPGEMISKEFLEQVKSLLKMGYTLHFSESKDNSGKIVCIK